MVGYSSSVRHLRRAFLLAVVLLLDACVQRESPGWQDSADASAMAPDSGEVSPSLDGGISDAGVSDGGVSVGTACDQSFRCAAGLICRAGTCAPPRSCLELLSERPQTPDGLYRLEAEVGAFRVNPSPLSTYCDMSTDEGGWTLVTPQMIDSQEFLSVTPAQTLDARGGVILWTYVNLQGLDGQYPKHTVFLTGQVPWTKIRAHYEFAGVCWGWSIFGDTSYNWSSQITKLEVFNPALDIIRNQVRMGGSAGDAFDGVPHRADATSTNFWYSTALTPPVRSADVILRRQAVAGLAGPGAGAYNCSVGPGKESPTYWKLSQIFVR